MRSSVDPPERLSLANDHLRIELAPLVGGKITSLYSKSAGIEFLHQASSGYSRALRETRFEDADRSGWDECLPTVAASSAAGDHGDLWRQPWNIVEESGRASDAITLSCDCWSAPLRFTRRLSLAAAHLNIEYRVDNLSAGTVHFLWSAHPLLAVAPGDRIVLPSAINRVRVNSSRKGRLGGTEATWPIADKLLQNAIDLSTVGGPNEGTAEKLFAGPLPTGACGLYRTNHGTGLLFRFPSSTIPYAGIWLCYGGWPDAEAHTKTAQYAIAIEPTTSNADSLDHAIANGTDAQLEADGSLRWTMQLETYTGSLDEFTGLCNKAHPFCSSEFETGPDARR